MDVEATRGVVREREARGRVVGCSFDLGVLDDEARRLTYTILESPFAVRRYVATIRVAPVTGSRSETGETFVEWWADYDADAADEPGLTKLFAVGIFATGLRGLRAHLGG